MTQLLYQLPTKFRGWRMSILSHICWSADRSMPRLALEQSHAHVIGNITVKLHASHGQNMPESACTYERNGGLSTNSYATCWSTKKHCQFTIEVAVKLVWFMVLSDVGNCDWATVELVIERSGQQKASVKIGKMLQNANSGLVTKLVILHVSYCSPSQALSLGRLGVVIAHLFTCKNNKIRIYIAQSCGFRFAFLICVNWNKKACDWLDPKVEGKVFK